MITEDYVSFEVAKLLKENGFDSDKCIALYDLGNNNELVIDTAIYDYGAEDYLQYTYGDEWQRFGYYLAPTHQMAMKWLREVYKLHIYADYEYDRGFQPNIIDLRTKMNMINEMYNGYTYEQIIEEALKYSLENLI